MDTIDTIYESLPSKTVLRMHDILPVELKSAKEDITIKRGDDFPDGGLRAWLVVFGVSLGFFWGDDWII